MTRWPEESELEHKAKFEAARKEIEYRTQAQLALFTLNISAVGLLGGFYTSGSGDSPLFLLLIGLISPSIGLQWLDHAFTIDRLGDYCRTLGFDWETKVAKERMKVLRRTLFLAQVAIAFGVSGAVAFFLLKGHPRYHENGNAWVAGSMAAGMMTAFFAVEWLVYWWYPQSQKRR